MQARRHHTEDASRDRPLGYHWRVDCEALKEILDLPSRSSRRMERAMAAIVADAIICAKNFPGRRISYSRRKAWWQMAKRYFGSDFSYATVTAAVDALVATEILIDHQLGWKNLRRPDDPGVQSSFLPAAWLAAVELPAMGVDVGELIRLRDTNRKFLTYRDTPTIRANRRQLKMINAAIDAAEIELEGVGEKAGDLLRLGEHWFVNPSQKSLYRVYSGTFELGGRLYGGWWQQVGKHERRHFRIDGERTCEIDFAQLHPRLLYAAARKTLTGDAYKVPGYDQTREERDLVKKSWNILLNTKSRMEAVGAMLKHTGEDSAEAKQIIDAVIARHPDIRNWFYSGMGLKLQFVDSQMCCEILQELSVKKGIVALPIHDSFIVAERHREVLEEAMQKAFDRAMEKMKDYRFNPESYVENDPHSALAPSSSLPVPASSGAADSESGRNRLQDSKRNLVGSAVKQIGRKTVASVAANRNRSANALNMPAGMREEAETTIDPSEAVVAFSGHESGLSDSGSAGPPLLVPATTRSLRGPQRQHGMTPPNPTGMLYAAEISRAFQKLKFTGSKRSHSMNGGIREWSER